LTADTWFDPAVNAALDATLRVPVGSPIISTSRKEVNNVIRKLLSAIKRWWNKKLADAAQWDREDQYRRRYWRR
jgi:hypothetical protein